MPVQLVGPKGVGKSTCLYALAIGIIKGHKEQENHSITPLYFTECSFTNISLMDDYLECLNLPQFDSLARTMITEKHRRFVLCIDIGGHNCKDLGDKLIKFTELLLGDHEHIRIIIAHSSGEGQDQKHKHFFQQLESRSGIPKELKTLMMKKQQYILIDAYGSNVGFLDLKRVNTLEIYATPY